MGKWIKWAAIGLISLVLVLAVILVIFIASFDPNTYKPKLQNFVLEKYSRTLNIQGDIELKFFPALALQLDDVSLSEANSTDKFASIDNAFLSLRLWPLLSNHLQIDHIKVSGLDAGIKRNKKGEFNFNDLLNPAASEQKGVDTKKSPASTVNDKSDKSGADDSVVDSGDSKLTVDIAGIDLVDSQVNYQDEASGLNINVYKIQAASGAIGLNKPFSVKIESLVNSNQPQLALHIDTEAMLKFSNNWHNVIAKGFSLNANGDLAEFKQGQAHFGADSIKWENKNLRISNLKLKANGDLATQEPISGISLSLSDGDIRLSHGEGNLSGKLALSEVRYKDEVRNVSLSDFAAEIESNKKETSINNIAANLYKGTLKADIKQDKSHKLKAAIDLDDVSLKPLIKAFSGKELIAGSGVGKIKINTDSSSTTAMLNNLAGTVSLHVNDGYVLGVNSKRTLIQLNELLSDFKNFNINEIRSPLADGEKTSFSRFELLMNIKNGVGTVDKLLLDSDLAIVTQGSPAIVDIAQKNLNMVINAKISESSDESNKLRQLLGVTIPVYITGSWSSPSYSVKIDDLIKDGLVQGALEKGLGKLLGKDKKPSESGSSNREESIGKALKGLFGS